MKKDEMLKTFSCRDILCLGSACSNFEYCILRKKGDTGKYCPERKGIYVPFLSEKERKKQQK